MSKLTAAIIEDEVPAARLLSSIITRLRPDWEVTVLPGSVEEAIVWFRTHSHPDILFLDIQLSDGNSFDFLSAAQLFPGNGLKVLFRTIELLNSKNTEKIIFDIRNIGISDPSQHGLSLIHI